MSADREPPTRTGAIERCDRAFAGLLIGRADTAPSARVPSLLARACRGVVYRAERATVPVDRLLDGEAAAEERASKHEDDESDANCDQ